MALSSPRTKTIKRLFALSANQCAMPDCEAPLVQGDVVVGEIAHICARSPDGKRYDPDQEDEERHGFGNLLLLCAPCHKTIDGEDSHAAYPAHELRRIKAEHEAKNAQSQRVNLDDDQADGFRDAYINSVIQTANISGFQNQGGQVIGIQNNLTSEQESRSRQAIQKLEEYLTASVKRNRFVLGSQFRIPRRFPEWHSEDLNHGNINHVKDGTIELSFDQILLGRWIHEGAVPLEFIIEGFIKRGEHLIVPADAVISVAPHANTKRGLSLYLDGIVEWDGFRFLFKR
ncbi:MAG: hypothetical protein H6739_29325 [Alphaproteobacteria bacterium]|nr:hypothetical protein [Alphaproteobacteria bacterium]